MEQGTDDETIYETRKNSNHRLFVQPDIDGLYVGRVAWDAKRFAGLIADCLATGEK